MQDYDHAYYVERIETELALARQADDIFIGAIHAELARQYQIHLVQDEIQTLRLVASN